MLRQSSVDTNGDLKVTQNLHAKSVVDAVGEGIDIDIKPEILGQGLSDILESSDNEEENKQYRLNLIKVINKLANMDMEACGKVLLTILGNVGYKNMEGIMIQALEKEMMAQALVVMAHQPLWRNTELLDLMVVLMTTWTNEEMKVVVSQLPRIAIGEKRSLEELPEYEEPDTSIEPDFDHPSSLFGYKRKLAELKEKELSRDRVEYQIKSRDNQVWLTLPYGPIGEEWLPEEIGTLIGRIFSEEIELDYITYFLVDLATQNFADMAQLYKWQDYLGYMGLILSSACAVNRKWENEDITWVYKDFCIDIGKWSLRQWNDFGETEYREFLCDVITQMANKRGDNEHDSKIIHAIMVEAVEEWDYLRADILAKMIEARMREKFPIHRLKNKMLRLFNQKTIPESVHAKSFLWDPPEKHSMPEQWEKEQLKLTSVE
eukprot:TRINITY_DN5741_c0_g2_i2.p1 TRINITY_DN5741_c0_g2~~TRINITY_DN5741_c0_g2_i2.p1  ORF type:complete len:433 (+),score=115.62 TRINITY_DN5741_c0_g2_i2:136-1434(+)